MEVEERVKRRCRGEWQASKGAILLTLDGGGFGVGGLGGMVMGGVEGNPWTKVRMGKDYRKGTGPPFLKI